MTPEYGLDAPSSPDGFVRARVSGARVSTWSGRNPRCRRRAGRRRCHGVWEAPSGPGGMDVRRCQWPLKMSGFWPPKMSASGSCFRGERSDRSGAAWRMPEAHHDVVSRVIGLLLVRDPVGWIASERSAWWPAERTAAGTGERAADMDWTSPAGCGNRRIRFAFCSQPSRVMSGSGILRCVPLRAHPPAAGDRRAPVPVVR